MSQQFFEEIQYRETKHRMCQTCDNLTHYFDGETDLTMCKLIAERLKDEACGEQFVSLTAICNKYKRRKE